MWIPASSELLLLVVELEAAAAVLECELVGGWEALSVRVKAPLKVCEWALVSALMSALLLLVGVMAEAAAAVLECESVGGWEALSVRVKAPLRVCAWAPRLEAPSVHRSEQALAMEKARGSALPSGPVWEQESEEKWAPPSV